MRKGHNVKSDEYCVLWMTLTNEATCHNFIFICNLVDMFQLSNFVEFVALIIGLIELTRQLCCVTPQIISSKIKIS